MPLGVILHFTFFTLKFTLFSLCGLRKIMIKESISKAINYLAETQLLDGEFPMFISSDERMENKSQFDSSPFGTAFVMYCLSFCNDEKCSKMIEKAKRFLINEMEEPGVWRYWSSKSGKHISPDLDDTCCESFILKKNNSGNVLGNNIELILNNRNDQGLFYTWIRSNTFQPNDIDSVVNSNVLLYLGEREETKDAINYLNDIIINNKEKISYWYYLDDISLYYMVSRAYFNGVKSLGKCAQSIINKILKRQNPTGSFGNELLTAISISMLLNLKYENTKVFDKAITYLLKNQQDNGSWKKIAFYTGPEPPNPHIAWFGSECLTTGMCVEALSRNVF